MILDDFARALYLHDDIDAALDGTVIDTADIAQLMHGNGLVFGNVFHDFLDETSGHFITVLASTVANGVLFGAHTSISA